MKSKLFFEAQRSLNLDLCKKFQRRVNQFATARAAVFGVAIIGFIFFVNERELTWALILSVVFLIAFVLLIKKFNKLKFIRDQHRYLTEINEEEIKRLEGDYSGIDGGAVFEMNDHPYADDLDILGKHSLYQLLNRTATYAGGELLAKGLLGKTGKVDLTRRQASLTELSKKPSFLQEYQALGRHVKAKKKDYNGFNQWLLTSSNGGLIKIRIWSYILPLIFLTLTLIATIMSISYYILLPVIIVNLVLLGRQHKYASEVVENTYNSLKMLRSFISHIDLVSKQQFTSKGLNEMTESFNKNDHHAKVEIGRITGLLENLEARGNIFHVFINIPFLLDIHWLTRIEEWREKNQANVAAWFATLAEFEVLISLAGQSFAEESWVIPRSSDKPYHLKCTGIGHPLITKEARVSNDFEMEGNGRVILLTGPNMAGKSTFLRTIGINIIMAKMGGVVCSHDFEFNPEIEVFTGMRIRDDLSDNISSFYAELIRIKKLITKAQNGESTFYFLDEILKGTNSADRHKGAEALIRQLSNLGVSGFVSTHDLELGKVASTLQTVQNYSFESIIEDGKINFDYKIREGICQSFNACELMRQMGIQV